MKELVKIYKDRGTQFIEDLFNDYVVITEKLSGSSFSFQKEGYNLFFYKGDNRKPINLIDRTLMIYYEPAIAYISSLSPDIFEGVPDNWRFIFQYFVHNAPGAITYDKLPKNNLVLTHIIVKDDKGKNAKIIEDPRIIKDWAERLNVTPMQPIFKGHLDERQKKKLLNFIEVPIEDQMELFGTTSFVAYIIKCLNPTINSTTLHTDLSKPIDSIIFKFYKPGSTQTFSAKMVDPYARALMKEKQPIDLRRAPADINEIVLLDILAFLEERGLKKHEVLSHTPEEKYLELISTLFNDYVEKRGDDLQKLDFQKADFAKGPEFDINLDLIRNEKTKKLIGGSEALKDLFKVMLGSLRKKRNPEKEGALFTKSIITDFNKMVDKIKDITKEEGDGKFKTFEDYLTLKNLNEELYIKDDLLDMIFEEQVLNYADFINISKFNINEALRVPHKNQGKKKVNMFAGRFQPFTSGHIKVLEDLHKQNGLPVMVMIVRGSKRDIKRTPFDEDAQQRMVAALQSQYPFIQGSIVVPNGAIDTMFSSLRPTYEPVLWGYGTDRKGSYDGQIQNDSYRAQLGVLPEFQGHVIRRGDEDVSASKVRNALERDDRKGYEKLVPRSLHDFYDELQNIMVPIEEGHLNEVDRKAGEVWKTATGFRGQDAKGDRKTFKSKEQTQQWMDTGKEDEGTDGLSDSTKEKLNSRADTLKKDFDRIAFSSEKDKEEFTKSFDKILKGERLSSEEAKQLSKYAKISDSKGKLKIYFAASEPGEFRQGAREKALDLTDKDGSMKKEMESLGMEITPATTVDGGVKPKIGPKDINPNKISGGKTYKPKVETKKNEAGEIEEITIGSTKIKRIKKPDQQKLTEKILEAYKEQNPDLNDKEIGRLVNRTNRAINRHNKNLSKWENLKDVEMIETVPGLEDLPQKERAEKIQKEYPKAISNKMRELIGDNPTEKEKEVLESIENLSNIESVEDFDAALVETLRKMDDVEALRKGSSDLAESFAYISMNKKGYRTELPAGGNFPVADLICLGGDIDLDPDNPDYARQVAMQGLGLAVNLESMGGISVKKDGGAASALKNKIGQSQFYNKETTNVLDSLADNHNNFLGTVADQSTPETIKKGNELLDKQQKWAVENGIIDKDKLPLTYGGRSPEQWADDTLADWEEKGKGPFPPDTKEALRGHCKACLLVAEIHNGDLEAQDYGNINIDTSKKDGGIHITDGVTNASLMKPSPNPGFKFAKGKGPNGTNVPRPNAIYSANLVHADYDPETGRFKMDKK